MRPPVLTRSRGRFQGQEGIRVTRMPQRKQSNSGLIKKAIGLTIVKINRNIYGIAGIAAFPTFLFWLYDTYYLYMERQYRSLFNKVKNSSSKVQLYDLDASKEPICYFKTLFRPTEAGVYLPIIAMLIISYLFLIN